MSLSDMRPLTPENSPGTTAARPRFEANNFDTDTTESLGLTTMGFMGRSLDTGRLSGFVQLRSSPLLRLAPLLETETDSDPSSRSMALLKMERHPSLPPHAAITSMTSTIPNTVPSDSHTGRVKNLLSCIVCSASSTVMSGDTVSGSLVMTFLTGVYSNGSSLATALVMRSLKLNNPTNAPDESTTSAALQLSAINVAVSRRLDSGDTKVEGLFSRSERSVGAVVPPKALAIKGPSSDFKAAFALCPPCASMIFVSASSAAEFCFFWLLSSLSIVWWRQRAMSKRPTTDPCSSTTGRCLKRFSIIMPNASMAES
mmetsp:Transcript_50955/g.76193  ORF Transcript_50955/g.76193 Transcript_50955/m.76193 type:complete len:314 (-) Transcript_50955:5740-6681(-)